MANHGAAYTMWVFRTVPAYCLYCTQQLLICDCCLLCINIFLRYFLSPTHISSFLCFFCFFIAHDTHSNTPNAPSTVPMPNAINKSTIFDFLLNVRSAAYKTATLSWILFLYPACMAIRFPASSFCPRLMVWDL